MSEKAAHEQSCFGFLDRHIDKTILAMTKTAVVEVRVASEECWVTQSLRYWNDFFVEQALSPDIDANLSYRYPPAFEQLALRLRDVLIQMFMPISVQAQTR